MWFYFALIVAFLTSVGAIIAKRVMKDMDEYSYLFVTNLVSMPMLLLIILNFYEIPSVDKVFYSSLLVSVVIGFFAVILSYRAIRISELSLVSPLSAFNPVFTSVIALLFLGEMISLRGWIGIFLIVIGSYLLKLSDVRRGFFQPIKSLLTHRGVQMSLVAYFLWSITPIFEKNAILHTAPKVPPSASLFGFMITTIIVLPFVLKKSKNLMGNVKKHIKLFIVIGIMQGIGQSAAFVAFSLTNLGYATAIFKLSIIFTVILGWLFFKEENIKERLLGSVVMLGGVILLVI